MIKKSTTDAQGFEKLERSKLSKLNYVNKKLFWTNSVDAVFSFNILFNDVVA